MVLDSKIKKTRDHFGIHQAEDWTSIRPEWILQLPGCGQRTLDHIRLYLAGHGITLRDDGTPAFWQRNLGRAQIGTSIADEDIGQVEPFTVLIDSAEKHPFTFAGFVDSLERPRLIQTEFRSLGPSHGDYSISGLERDCHIERKSGPDAHGTFLSHGVRRERWDRTLAFLAEVPCSAIVVECSFGELIKSVEARGKRSKGTLQKTLHRQVLAWAEDLRVPFHFCDTRRLAEATTLAILERRWREMNGLKKRGTQARQDQTQET